ncbi:MAG: PKD domain-containing protein [Bacteroidetes bacterium]|nr:PKD domain-containing protein [Bacteroidota bacterium]
MTRSFLSSLLFLLCLSAFSQATYTSAQFAAAGDSFLVSSARMDSVGSTDFSLTGTSYTWNYSRLVPQSQSMDRYLSAQTTGYKVSYTSSCVAGGGSVSACNSSWNALVNLGHQELDSLKVGSFKFSNVDALYYKSTSTLPINIVGMTFGLSGVNFPLTFRYTRPDTVYRWPMAYANQDSCLSSYAIDLTSLGINFVYKVSTLRVNTVEGWGTLITPYRSYSSVLKLKTLQYSYDTLFYNTSVIPVPATTSVQYSWFDPGYKRAVLVANGNIAAGATVYTTIEYMDTVRCLDPKAQFTPDPLVPYLNQGTQTAAVSFNNSSDNANQYSWDFGDTANAATDTSHLANPSHTYTASGVYLVRLIACNGVCSPLRCDTFTEPVTILDSTNTQASYTYTPLQPCIGDTVRFTNTSLNANNYHWDFGDNSTSVLRNPRKAYSAAGTYTIQLIASGSVRSDTSYQTITVSTTPVATITAGGALTQCQGDSVVLTAGGGDYYRWSTGSVYSAITVRTSGTYTVTAYNNCGNAASQPVVVTFATAVAPAISVTDSPSNVLCTGSSVTFHSTVTNGGTTPSYQWKKNNTTVATTASYTYTPANNDSIWCILTSSAACATSTTATSSAIHLTVKPNSSTSVSQSICAGSSYTFYGHTLTSAGTYHDTLTSANGCDSIITLTLTVKPNSTASVSQSICAGSSYTFYGHVLTTAGTYHDTLTSANGCDSIITLTLTVKPSSTASVSQSICAGSSYTFYGHTLTSAGTYHDTLTSANGCDSIITLTLTVKPNSTASVSQSICAGSSYTFYGHVLTSAGTYHDTLTSANGCDSIITLTLTVKPNSTASVSQSICAGSSYTFYGHVLTSAGTYRDTLTSANGCDSIITLTLTVKPNYTASVSQSICAGSSYTFYGHMLTAAGTYHDTLTSANGCDSIITLTLTVKPNSTASVSQSICAGSSYTFYGHVLTTAGTYHDTLTSANGCDSIITLTLTVKPNSTSTQTISLCQGSSYVVNGHTITTSGTYYDTLASAQGCDSFVTYYLNFVTTLHVAQTVSICQGSAYTFGGQVLTMAGTYSDTAASTNGCDSITTLTLVIRPLPIPAIHQSGVDTLYTGTFASYTWLYDSAVAGNAQAIMAGSDGDYRVLVTDSTGCSDTSAVYHYIRTGISMVAGGDIRIYPNPVGDILYISLPGGYTTVTLHMTDGYGQQILHVVTASRELSADMRSLVAGVYTLTLSDQRGALSIQKVVKY